MKINDNSRADKLAVSRIPKMVEKIANKTLTELEDEGVFVFPECIKDTEDLNSDQMVLQKIGNYYYTGNIMGFLGCGEERLTISSRFSSHNSDFFLQYMLDKVLDYPNVFDLETQSNSNNQLINILMFLFPLYLRRAMRKGLFKKYVTTKYNDSNLKGNVNISRHIKENTPFVGNIAYDKREQLLDNYMSQLIRHTIEFIKGKRSGKQILAWARDDVGRIVEATSTYNVHDRKKVLADNKKHVVRHAYFREYRALQKLCILILQYQKQELGSGITRVYGVLFDGAWLWEEYVNSLVKEYFYHPKNKERSGAEQLFTCKRKIGLIYPDFISKNVEERVIADAKYKPFSNIGNRDYLQLLAYMMRFESKRGMFLYPESGCEEDALLLVNRGSTHEKNVEPRTDTFIVKHGLKIPVKAKDYNDFSLRMKDAENDFVRSLITIL
ncbi:MAG: hypothetical protein IKU25_08230 [Clostridia bacterium]|nr:hypothetical protein [Clostridia bacterium]